MSRNLVNGYLLPNEQSNPISYGPFIGPSAFSPRPLKFSASLVCLVHGKLSTGQPASLIVTEFRLDPCYTTRRFTRLAMELFFTPEESIRHYDEETATNFGLEIHSLAPHGRFELKRTSPDTLLCAKDSPPLEEHVPWEFKPGFHPNQGTTHLFSAKFGGKFNEEVLDKGGDDSVNWSFYEDPKAKSGTPTIFRTAILIKRSGDVNFTGVLLVYAEADLNPNTRRPSAKTHLGRSGIPIYFNVKQSEGNICANDLIFLGDFNRLDDINLKDYVYAASTKEQVQAESRP